MQGPGLRTGSRDRDRSGLSRGGRDVAWSAERHTHASGRVRNGRARKGAAISGIGQRIAGLTFPLLEERGLWVGWRAHQSKASCNPAGGQPASPPCGRASFAERRIAERFQQQTVIEPGDPFQRRVLHVVDATPRVCVANDLDLERVNRPSRRARWRGRPRDCPPSPRSPTGQA